MTWYYILLLSKFIHNEYEMTVLYAEDTDIKRNATKNQHL